MAVSLDSPAFGGEEGFYVSHLFGEHGAKRLLLGVDLGLHLAELAFERGYPLANVPGGLGNVGGDSFENPFFWDARQEGSWPGALGGARPCSLRELVVALPLR